MTLARGHADSDSEQGEGGENPSPLTAARGAVPQREAVFSDSSVWES